MFSLLFHFIFISYTLKKTICQPCVFSEQEYSFCELCSFSYFQQNFLFSKINEENIVPFAQSSCYSKDTINTYKKKVFIKLSSSCVDDCDGTSLKPFWNLYTALEEEEKKAQPYLNVEIEFLLIDQSNIIMTKTASSSENRQFFRRAFALLIIRPALCSDLLVAGCFADAAAIAELKINSAYFSIFVARELTIILISMLLATIMAVKGNTDLKAIPVKSLTISTILFALQTLDVVSTVTTSKALLV